MPPENTLGIASACWTLPIRSSLLVPAMPQHRLIVNFARLESHRIWVDGRAFRSGPSDMGSIRIAPPGETARAEVMGARFNFAQVYLPASALAAAQYGRSRSPLIGLRDPKFNDRDPHLLALVQAFLTDRSDDSMHREHIAMAIASHLVGHYGISQERTAARSERLHPRLARRIEEFIHAHLDAPLTLLQLASLAQLSEYHFARAFAGTFGVAPYRYAQQQRISRARTLLIDTDRSIADTALACGFSSQAAFTTAFKKQTGRTPHFWRSDCWRRHAPNEAT